jgi:hypothetical protein
LDSARAQSVPSGKRQSKAKKSFLRDRRRS